MKIFQTQVTAPYFKRLEPRGLLAKVAEFFSSCCQKRVHEKKGPNKKNKVFQQEQFNTGNLLHSNQRARKREH